MIKKVKRQLKYHIKNMIPSDVRQKLQPRKIQAFCVGIPKTGTTSFAAILEQNYRAAHEPEYGLIVSKMYQHYHHQLTDGEYCRFLRKRGKRLWLDFESSCFMGYRPDLLYRAFPDAKYILTVREPKSWLDSNFNDNINYPASMPFNAYWHEVFFEPHKYSYTPYGTVLKEYNLYPIDAYLTYWVSANSSVVQAIPDYQLLIIDLKQLNRSIHRLADFLSIAPDSLNIQNSHRNKTKTEKKYDIINLIDANYLQDRIDALCAEWKSKLFDS